MTERARIPATRLRELLMASNRKDDGIAVALMALAEQGDAVMSVSKVPKSELLHIYGRRLTGSTFNPGSVAGANRLLADLDGYIGQQLRMITFEHKKSVVSILLDEDTDRLVAATVGPDRRQAGAFGSRSRC